MVIVALELISTPKELPYHVQPEENATVTSSSVTLFTDVKVIDVVLVYTALMVTLLEPMTKVVEEEEASATVAPVTFQESKV